MLRPRLLALPLAAALLALAPSTLARQDGAPPASPKAPQAPGKKKPGGEGGAPPLLEGPDVELGELFKDAEWGFEFRLPKDMHAWPAERLEAFRKLAIKPEEQRKLPDGKIQKVQIFVFEDERGGSVTIEASEPPVKVESPQALRQLVHDADRRGGLLLADVGKLLQFRARGSRVGFVALREWGERGATATTDRTMLAYLTNLAVSLVVRMNAPKERFADSEAQFSSSLRSFALRENAVKPVSASELAPARESPGFSAPATLASAALLLGMVVLLVQLARGRLRGAPASATASGAGTTAPSR